MSDRFEVFACDGAKLWPYFAAHHYLTGDYSGHDAVVGVWNGRLAAFSSSISFPTGTITQRCVRGHRTVVLPDFQGLGLGSLVSDTMADLMLKSGCRYYTKTSHPKLGEYRNSSPLWKPSRWHQQKRDSVNHLWSAKRDAVYCHEYIGADPSVYEAVMNPVKRDDQLSLLLDR